MGRLTLNLRGERVRWPFQLVPVIALAIWDRLPKVWPFQAKPSSKIHDPLELALPFTHEQRADLQTDPFSRLRLAAVERSADAILFAQSEESFGWICR